MELKQSVAIRVPVQLFDSSTGQGKTGVAFGSVTCYLQKQATASAQKTITTDDWFEIDATNMPGVYDLLLSTTDTNTLGFLKYSVTASGCDIYLGVLQVVAALTADVYKINKNRWKIDTSTNQLYIYDDNGTTILHTFDLKNANGDADATSIFERVPV